MFYCLIIQESNGSRPGTLTEQSVEFQNKHSRLPWILGVNINENEWETELKPSSSQLEANKWRAMWYIQLYAFLLRLSLAQSLLLRLSYIGIMPD